MKRALGLLIALSWAGPLLAQGEPAAVETNLVPRLLDAFTQLQSQHVATVQALADARLAAATAAQDAARQLDGRVQRVEATLRQQHDRELAALRESQRATLQAVTATVVIALLVIVCSALLFQRGLARRAEPGPVTALAPLRAVDVAPVEPATNRLVSAVDDLERRLAELETSTTSAALPGPQAEPGLRAELLVGRGQSLLGMQQFEPALACFREAAELEPTNPDVFIRQGVALEKLGRLDDALALYDQALALDTKLTMAYLRKGGVFNRLERHPEALACYEQALRTHNDARAA
jgi:tetratricopeptide (TPR) repeat protein